MKHGMSHYNHKSIPDAKFEAPSFGDMTSRNSIGRRERVIKFGYLSPENRFTFKKMNFYVQNRSSRPKIDPMPISANFKQKKIFHFQNFWDISMRKE